MLKKGSECFESLLCGCQQPRPKRDCLLCVARHTAVTLTWDAPLSFGTKAPGSLSQATNHQEFVSPVLALVESFPGAMSPLGSKESYEPTYCQTLHPSYKLRRAQHERKILNDIKIPRSFLRQAQDGL